MQGGFKAPPRSALRRRLDVGGLGSGLALRFGLSKLRGLFVSRVRRKALLDAHHAESTQRVLQTMGHMKGAIMKLGQIASYVSTDLPERSTGRSWRSSSRRRRRSSSRRSATSASSAHRCASAFARSTRCRSRQRGRGEGAVPRHRRGDPRSTGSTALARISHHVA